MLSLEGQLSAKVQSGGKVLVPYVCGGLGKDWIETIWSAIEAGADAVEVGIPFSDPMMDGPVIQQASQLALEAGATPQSVLSDIKREGFGVPIAVMTYYNLVHHAGLERFGGWMADAAVSGAIFPDLSYEESEPWRAQSGSLGIETVQLVAPSTSTERAKMLCEVSRGFVYGVGLMGVTGERDMLAPSAVTLAKRLKGLTDRSVLIGVGISTPPQAREASRVADGVVVGSAVVRRMLDGEGPFGVGRFIGELRVALDQP